MKKSAPQEDEGGDDATPFTERTPFTVQILDQHGSMYEHERIVGSFSTDKGTLILYRIINGEAIGAIQYAPGWRRMEVKES